MSREGGRGGTVAGSPWLTLVIALGLLPLFAVPGYRIIREAKARLTKEGRKAFAAYLDGLSRLIEVAR